MNESIMNGPRDDLNCPKRGARSGRELLTILLAAVLVSSLWSVFFETMGAVSALLAGVAVSCAGLAGALWWQFRGRQRFPLKSPPRIRLVVGSSRP